MFGWLTGGVGSIFGRGSGASASASGGGAPYQGLTLTAPTDYVVDRIRSDLLNYPYKGPGDLDRDGGETAEQRSQYRAIYQREGVVTAAIDGKMEGVAAERVTIEPFDRSDPRSRDEAEFLNWSVEQAEGWDTLAADILRPAFVDGWSVLEVTLKQALHPRHGQVWALRHCRSLDTRFLRLQMDPFRNITGVVSLVRGLESFSPDKVLVYTHRRMFHNHFGVSDMRPVFRDAKLLEDAYLLWYAALRLYGEPYIVGTMKEPQRRKQFEGLLAAFKGGRWAAIPDGDKIELLSLASAVNFQAFEAKVEQLNKNIFMSVRGSALPFMQGRVAGGEARGNTRVSEGKSDNKETLIGKQLCRVYARQLAPILLVPNFGADVVHRLPKANIGGTDWKAKKEIMDTLAEIREKFPGVVSLSKADIGVQLAFPPALGPDDEANPGQPPQGPQGPGGGPGGGKAPPLQSPTPMPSGSATDGPTALPAPPAAKPADTFSAADAGQYGSYFAADQHGRFPGDMHKEFACGVAEFARTTGLLRKEVGKGADRRWVWVARPEVVPDKTFSDTAAASVAGGGELGLAVMQAYADGDDALADALADLAADPDGFAELVADIEGGHHGEPGKRAFAAMLRTFAAETRTFAWTPDPTPRSKTRITHTESGVHAYGKRAAQLLAAQQRADRGEPEPPHPAREKAKRLREEREPGRAAARVAWDKATTDPASLSVQDVVALRDHLDTLTRDEVRAAVKAIRGGGHGGKLKVELVDALLEHARGLVSHERGKESVLHEALTGYLAANPKATDDQVLGVFGRGRPEVARRVLAEVRENQRGAALRGGAGASPPPAPAPKPAPKPKAAPELAPVLAAHAAAPEGSKLRGYLDAAVANASPPNPGGPEYDAANPPPALDAERLRRLRKGLTAGHAEMHRAGDLTPEADAAWGGVMAGMGMAPLHAAGEETKFDPATMESPTGMPTGAPVRVVRRGWSGHYGDPKYGPTEHEGNYRRALVEPVKPVGPTPAELEEARAAAHRDARLDEANAPQPSPDDHDRERHDRAEAHAERMRRWAADKPGSVAAEDAVRRAEARLGRTFSDAPAAVPTHAGLCVRAADTGRVLLIQRADTPGDAAAGLWEFPGGKIEPGETPLQGAAREWTEEVGIHLPLGHFVGEWASDDGIYKGHVWELPTEAGVSFEGRTGDRGELVAWWAPGDLAADDVRPELVDSLGDVTRAFADGQPPRPGLVPQTGDAQHPGHWVLPDDAGGGAATPSPPVGHIPSDAPNMSDGPPPDHTKAAVTQAVAAAGAPVGLVAQLSDAALTAAAKAHLALVKLTPAMLAAIETVTTVFDTPQDMQRFGFNPTLTSGGYGPRTADPVASATGVSAHLAGTIAAKLIGSGLAWVRKTTGVRLYAAEPDVANAAALPLREAFAAVATELGLEGVPSAKKIASHMRAVVGRGKSFSAGWEEAKHPRDHGKFAPKPVAQGAAVKEKGADKGGESREWDGTIDATRVEVNDGWHDHNVESYTVYDGDGDAEEESISIESGTFDPNPDDPDSEPIEVFRWNDPGGDEGEWTADEGEARRGAGREARRRHEDPPDPEDSHIPDGIGGARWADQDHVADWTDSDGDEQEVRLDEAEFEWGGRTHTAYRWTTRSSDDGEWTLDRRQAIRDGREFADNSHVEPRQGGDDEEVDDETWAEWVGEDGPGAVKLAGAECGASAKVKFDDAGNVEITVSHPKIEDCVRTIHKDAATGAKYIHNDLFIVKPAYRSEGLGVEWFAREVEAAGEAGMAWIECHAAGPPANPHMNGCYTWPKFGYDQGIGEFTAATQAKILAAFPDAKSVLDILASPGGEEWWCGKKNPDGTRQPGNGVGMLHAKFDLTPGSRSMRVLEAYRKKAAAKKST